MVKKRSTATRRAESQAASARAAAIRQEQERKERRRRSLVVTAVGLVVLIAIVGIAAAVRSASSNAPGSTASPPAGAVATYAVPAGPASAPVKVTIYEDFICPFCGEFEKASRTALQQDIDAGKVQMQYHVLNFLDRNSSTQYSLRAANALAAVLDTAGPTAAKKFHDLLFENQPAEGSAGLSDNQLINYAVQAGALRSKVSNAIKHKAFEKWVKNGTDQASKSGVTGTPTVRVNGKQLAFSTTGALVTDLEKIIDQGGS